MKRKIAIPMQNGKLCAHFGHCEYFAIVTVDDNHIIDIKEERPPAHEPGAYPRFIAAMGVSEVIAGGMGERAASLLEQQNIKTFLGAPVKEAKTIAEEFIAGTLALDSNSCNHDHHHDHNHNCHH